jgi:hypothetical protein
MRRRSFTTSACSAIWIRFSVDAPSGLQTAHEIA